VHDASDVVAILFLGTLIGCCRAWCELDLAICSYHFWVQKQWMIQQICLLHCI